jgi:hypothetical protein
MTDIPKLLYRENARKVFRFTFNTTTTPAPTVSVDEASVKIVESHQRCVSGETQTRPEVETRVRALAELAESHKRVEAEAQELAQPCHSPLRRRSRSGRSSSSRKTH